MLTITDIRERQVVFLRSTELDFKEIQILNGNLSIKTSEEFIHKVPLVKISAVILVGQGTLTTSTIASIIQHGGSLILCRPNFATYASFHANASGNYLLRKSQYIASAEQELAWAKKLMATKIECQLRQLVHYFPDKKDSFVEFSTEVTDKIATAPNADILRGIEGTVQKRYFEQMYGELGWLRRIPQAKLDEINVLLDIGYSMLFHLTDCFLQLFGFDTYKGFYHTLFFQRKSLACDVVEPFRVLIDRSIRKMYSLKQVDPKDFTVYGPNYNLSWEKSAKYYKIFAAELMEYREDLYLFCQQLYRHHLKPEKYPFPQFKYKPYR